VTEGVVVPMPTLPSGVIVIATTGIYC
jgi:hypothetical protein